MSNELAPQNSTAILDTQMRYAEVLAFLQRLKQQRLAQKQADEAGEGS